MAGKLLSSGNPQVATGYGRDAVQNYLSAMPAWKRDVGAAVDQLVRRAVSPLSMAVKWNTAFYGSQPSEYFLSLYCYKSHVQLGFLNGSELDPPPPGQSKVPRVRYLNVREHDHLDEDQLTAWFVQASRLAGERL